MERTAKASVMMWFKKLLSKRDVSQSNTSTMMNWFKRSRAEQDKEQELKTEIDVVPQTEITASRQALNNINIALNADESAGESSGKYYEKSVNDENKMCKNKYCCGSISQVEPPLNGVDESIKDYRNSKSTLIDNLRGADNKAHESGSIFNETECRRPSRIIKNVKNDDYIIIFDPFVDYGRLECPDSAYPSVIDYPSIRYGRYVQLKSKKNRHYSNNFDLFTTSDKPKLDDDKSPFDYKLLSNVEKQLDETKYNLLKCKLYNQEYRRIHTKGSNCTVDWVLEDFNDDKKSTRMSDDTRTIKEFYRLSIDSHLLVHFQDIVVDTGRTVESYSKSFLNFFTWLALKGKEINEQHKTAKTSWIKAILSCFKKSKLTKDPRKDQTHKKIIVERKLFSSPSSPVL